jgi:hypothetical protein
VATAHDLPDEPGAVVIEWRTSGGLGASEADEPDLVVRADGTVTVGPRFGAGAASTGRLEPERLQALLGAIIDGHRFFDFDPARVEAAVAAARATQADIGADEPTIAVPPGPPYIDAGDTCLAVNADGRHHEVRWHGVVAAAREHPGVGELQDLRAVQEALVALADAVASGRDW